MQPIQHALKTMALTVLSALTQHAGIYMSEDSFHASTSSGVMHSLNGFYWCERISQARRFD